MATRTLAQMATEALAYLGLIAQGQSASAEDQLKAENATTAAYRQLRRRGLAPYASSAFPEEHWDTVTRYVAAELGPKFGKPFDPISKQLAEDEIRKQVYRAKKAPGFVGQGKYH